MLSRRICQENLITARHNISHNTPPGSIDRLTSGGLANKLEIPRAPNNGSWDPLRRIGMQLISRVPLTEQQELNILGRLNSILLQVLLDQFTPDRGRPLLRRLCTPHFTAGFSLSHVLLFAGSNALVHFRSITALARRFCFFHRWPTAGVKQLLYRPRRR